MDASRTRKSAEERREEIIGVAMRHFAAGGYNGTSTEATARETGLSQPYLFRLFRTKKELFLACTDRANRMVRDVFERAAASAPEGEVLKTMGHAYVEELLPDRHAVLMQMQGYVATSDPEIQEHVRSCYRELVHFVAQRSGSTLDEVWSFFAHGMLLNVVVAL